MRYPVRARAAAMLVAGASALARAQAPLTTAFTYQGELGQAGSPANGVYDLQFALFDSLGNAVGAVQCFDNVTVTAGRFSVVLDFGAQFQGLQRFLEVRVRADTGLACANPAGFTTLSPRQALNAAPYALYALNAVTAATATTATNATQFNGQAASFYQNAGNLSSGTLSSARLAGTYSSALTLNNVSNVFAGSGAGLTGVNADLLDGLNSTAFLQSVPNPLTLNGSHPVYIIGALNSSAVNGAAGVSGTANGASGQVYGVQGVTASTNGFGVFGTATSLSGPAHGGFFETSSTDGIGVVGQAKATSGSAYGVYGQSTSSSGRGVFGLATAGSGATFGGQFESVSPSGTGVFGHATAGSGTTSGVYGQAASPSGFGVQGYAYNPSGANYGGYFHSDSTSGTGVYGSADAVSGTTYGGRFASASPTGNGVFGIATASSGLSRGLYGQSASSSGRAVQGWATSTSGTNFGGHFQSDSPGGRGVYGFASAGSGATYGGYFETSSAGTDAAGVFAQASALTGTTYGVWGQSNSTSGYGVIGINARTSGTTFGVFGRSSGTDGAGVYGAALSTSGQAMGVRGETNAVNGVGVSGRANDTSGAGLAFGVEGTSFSPSGGYGVRGIAAALTGSSYGVYGTTLASGFAVYANGNFGANGLKAFRIDHPDDPTNKYLLHYSSESPEVINFYSGKVSLNDAGEAVVEMPAYFAKINTDPRYTLTAVGAPMPLLHVAEEIDDGALAAGAKMEPGEVAPRCAFRIAGGMPGAKVSWRVEAVRNDRWVQRNGAPVEVLKQGHEAGTYQRPELYGQPAEKGMDYDTRRLKTGAGAAPAGVGTTGGGQ